MRAFLAILLLAGCSHSAVRIGNATPVAPSNTVNATGAVAAAVVIGTAAIAASQEVNDARSVPAMAGGREIAEQDCTQPVDFSAGNLRCR